MGMEEIAKCLLLSCLLSLCSAYGTPTLIVEEPANNSVVSNPVLPSMSIALPLDLTVSEFNAIATAFCVIIDGADEYCYPVGEPYAELILPHGEHSLEGKVVGDSFLIAQSQVVTFTVGTKEDVVRHLRDQFELAQAGLGSEEHGVFVHRAEETILEWFDKQQTGGDGNYDCSDTHNESRGEGGMTCSHTSTTTTTTTTNIPTHKTLVIGVKSSIESGFKNRQAIRETWGHFLPSGAKLYFVVGNINKNMTNPACGHSDGERCLLLERALQREKDVFKDVLTNELHVIDSYYTLVEKTSQFLKYITIDAGLSFDYVMIADDDIYLRTDELLLFLSYQHRRTHFYGGTVWNHIYGRATKPIREGSSESHKNTLSRESYPLDELPPFAIGPHYVMSRDVAHFVGRNTQDLRGVGTLEDVSIGFWLLATQTHAVNLMRFVNMKNALACVDSFLSLADLTTYGIRAIHDNVMHHRNLCDGFARIKWVQSFTMTVGGDGSSSTRIDSDSDSVPGKGDPEGLLVDAFLHDSHTVAVHIPLISETGQGSSITELFNPLTGSISIKSMEICRRYSRLQGDCLMDVFHMIRNATAASMPSRDLLSSIGSVHSLLVSHNLNVALSKASPDTTEDSRTIHVGYSPGAGYGRRIYDSMFTGLFPDYEIVYGANVAGKYDYVVLSILDGGCASGWDPVCQQEFQRLRGMYKDSRIIMISGESWDLSASPLITDDVILLTTRYDAAKARPLSSLYLPVVSTSFAERRVTSPSTLLERNSQAITIDHTRKFCAYLYSRCNHRHREHFYDVLNEFAPVTALGKCEGDLKSRRASRPSSKRGRDHEFWHDDAVEMYKSFKFVIAFENSIAPGYVSEKIVNAFLANSVPIYYGDSVVREIFNEDSFIDCSKFTTFLDCAYHVMYIDANPDLYMKMLLAPKMKSEDVYNQVFSWHPDVRDDRFVTALKPLLGEQSGK